MSQTNHTHGSHGNVPGKGGRARGDPLGTSGSTGDGQLAHSDPLDGLASAQTGATTKTTLDHSSNQVPGAVINQGASESNNNNP